MMCGQPNIKYTCVTFQSTNYELPEDDTSVLQHVGVL
jgi:hypothetical protein